MGAGREQGRRRRAPFARARVRAGMAAVAVLAAGATLAQVPLASAQFTATTGTADSTFGAAATWCTSPGAMVLPVQNDTWLNQADPTRNYVNDIHLEVRARAGQARRTLIRPILPPIPSGCSLVTAVLTLDEHGFSSRTMQVTQVTSAWDVATVTWSTRPTTGGTPVESVTTPTTWTVDITSVIAGIYAAGINHGFQINDKTETTASSFDNTWHSINDTDYPYITYTWA